MSRTDRQVGWLVLAYLGFIMLGSWVPLNWQWQAPGPVWAAFVAAPGPAWRSGERVDLAVNVLLTVPLGFGLAYVSGSLQAGALRWAGWIAAWPLLAAISLGVEFMQGFLPVRDPSWTDVVAQWVGAAVGLAAYAVWGRRARQVLQGLAGTGPPLRRAQHLLLIYVALLLAYALMPMDLTLSPVELYRKWRDGRVILLPFGASGAGGLQSVYDLVSDVLLWMPVGLLWRLSTTPPAGRALVWRAVLLTAGVELAQLLVLSRVSDVTDVLLGTLGVVLGSRAVALAGLVRAWPQARRLALVRAAALGWLALAVMVLWAPFDFEPTRADAGRWWAVVSAPPLQTYFARGEFGALGELLRKLLLFLPAGVLLAAHESRAGRRAAVAAATGVFALAFVLEAGQVLLPSKVPAVTDAVLGCLGALLGWRLARVVVPLAGGAPAPLPTGSPAGAERRREASIRIPQGSGPPDSLARWVFPILGLASGFWLLSRLPGVPYNVVKLVPSGPSGLISALGLALVVWWMLAAPVWLLVWRGGRWAMAFAPLLLAHATLSFVVLRASVPLPMLHKVIGTPVLAWPGPLSVLEDLGRYAALHLALMLPLIGAALVVRTVTQPRAVPLLVMWLFVGALLFAPLHAVVVIGAGTDNLVELMRGGGDWLTSLALASAWGLLALAGSALAAALAGARQRVLLWALVPVGLAAAALLFVAGLEPALVKYDQVFSAAQFLLSASRQHYAQGAELTLRAAVTLAGIVVVVGLLQWAAWRRLELEPISTARR